MQLTADQFSLSKLLSDNTRVRIPEYQRNYAWDAQNIDQYLSDIDEAIQSKDDHFFGPIVLLDEGDHRFSVIDGQQRLTTTMMLLALIRDQLVERGEPQHEIAGNKLPLKHYIDEMLKHKNYIDFRFTANHQIAEIFENYVLRDPGPLRKTLTKTGKGKDALPTDKDRENTKALRSAYFRLTEGLTARLDEHGDNETRVVEFLWDLIDTLRNSMKVLRITVPDENDAYVLFETLNDRGVKLTAPDLLKSYTLREAKDLEMVAVEDVIHQWDLAVERLGNYPFERFLRHYLLSIQDKEAVQAKKIFPMFKQRIHEIGPIANLEEIAAASSLYAQLLNDKYETPDDDLNATLDRINLISDTHRVFLLAVFRGEWSAELLNYAARATEMIAFRWTLRGGNAQQLETLYQKYAGRVRRDALPGNVGALTQILEDLMAEAPSDDSVKQEILTASIKPSHRMYVLTRLEGALTGDLLRWTKQETWVQELAPSTPSEKSNWYEVVALPKGSNAGDEKAYEDYVQMWGNLTMTEFELDNSVKHAGWERKVAGADDVKGFRDSQVKLTQGVVQIDQLTKDHIVGRTGWMAEAVALITSAKAAANQTVRIEPYSAR